MRYCLIVILAMAAICCGPKHQPVQPSSDEPCIAARDRLLVLQCMDEGRLLGGPTKRGIPFEEFCKHQMQEGLFSTAELNCIATVESCAQVDKVCAWGQK